MLETNKRQQRRVYIYIEQKMRKKMRKKMIEKSCFWGRGINFSLPLSSSSFLFLLYRKERGGAGYCVYAVAVSYKMVYGYMGWAGAGRG